MENEINSLVGIKQFLALLPDTVLIVNRSGKIEDLLNYQPEISVSLPPEEQKKYTIHELFRHKNLRGDSGHKLLKAFLDTIETRKANIITYEIESEGHVGYAEGYIVPFEEYTFGIFRNITERTKAQLDAIEQKNRLTMALKAGNLCVWSYLPHKDTFAFYDENMLSKTEFKLADVTNQILPEDRERHLKAVTDIVNEIYPQSVEQFRLLTLEGKIRWYEIYALGIREEEGKVNRVIGTLKDITDQKNKVQELLENRQQRDLLLKITNMIIWEYDRQTEILTSDKEQLFFIHDIKWSDCYKIIAPEHQETYKKAFDDLLNKHSDLMNIKVRVKTFDNTYRWVQLIAIVSKYDREGNVEKLIGTRADITEEMEREQSLRNYIRRSELAIESANIIQWDFDIETLEYTRLFPDPPHRVTLPDGRFVSPFIPTTGWF